MKYGFHLSAPLILCAIALDLAAGDPHWIPHPVRLIGALIAQGEAFLWSGRPSRDLCSGAILAAVVPMAAAAAACALIAMAGWASDTAAGAAAVIIAWTTLAIRGLDSAAAAVERELNADDLDDLIKARHQIRALVGRDPDSLDRLGLVRATIESVAENCSDGVIAPMFYLFAGGPVAAIAYKAINTLDSMIGYLNEHYRWFGRGPARLDDLANLLPARITALCLIGAAAAMSRRGGQAYAACITSASMHTSPNGGYPEAAMAGALGIQLGGDAVYSGEIEHRAAMGVAEREPVVADIALARTLMRCAAGLAFCLFALGRYAVVQAIRHATAMWMM